MLATLLTLALLLPVLAMLHRITAGRSRLPIRQRLALLANDRGEAGSDDGDGDDGDDDGEDEDSDADSDDADDDEDADDDDDKKLGPKGEKALAAEKAKRRDAQRALREFRQLGLTPAQIRDLQAKGGRDDDGDKPDPEKIRDEARREARLEAQRERVADKIEAKARAFADPEDAVALVLRQHDPDDFLDDDGKVDAEAIQDALDELLEKKPHLAAQGGKRFKGSGDGGARKERKAKATSLEGAIASRFSS